MKREDQGERREGRLRKVLTAFPFFFASMLTIDSRRLSRISSVT
jgi:hypothetical protein